MAVSRGSIINFSSGFTFQVLAMLRFTSHVCGLFTSIRQLFSNKSLLSFYHIAEIQAVLHIFKKTPDLRFKIFLIQFIGLLFITKGFDVVELLIYGKENLEVYRSNISFSFYSDFDKIAHYLFFISVFGLAGLIIGILWSFFITTKTTGKKYLLIISTAGVFLLNKLFPTITSFIEFKSKTFSNFSVFTILVMSAAISILTGILILSLQFYLVKLNHYLKVHVDQPYSMNL